jgi:hypothetical protein
MKIKSKKYIKKKYKGNKNTIKRNTRKRNTRKRNRKIRYTKKMKGGDGAPVPQEESKEPKNPGPIQSELIKAKGMAMNPAPISLKALPTPMGALSKIASSAGDSLKKMVPTSTEISKAMLPKTTTKKDKLLSALSMVAKPVVVPFRFTKAILKSMRNIVTATLVMPTLSMNQILPPELCKFYLKNDRICSQTVSEYLFKGSKADFEKRDLPQTTPDNEECIEFNINTNKYEQCKPDKMKGGSGKELIIRCKGNIKHGFYKNDRVMIYVEVPPGEDPIVANKLGKNTYIGKILSISGDRNQNFEIELENSEEEPMELVYDDKDPNIMKYDKNFQSFLSEFEKYFQDMYKNDIKWSKKSNKRLKKAINIFLVASLYTLVGALAIPTVIGLAAALEISIVTIGTVGLVGAISVGTPVVILDLCYQIYIKIAESKTRQAMYLAMMKKLIDDDKVKSEKKNLYILQQLVKINHNLRLYRCPKDKLESIFEMIRDVELLKKIQNIVQQFLEGEDKSQDPKSQDICDKEYDALNQAVLTKFKLKPDIEYVPTKNHLFNYFRPFYIEPEEPEPCKKINRLKPANILDSFTKTIAGDKDNIAHIVINVFQGISSSDGDIYDNTKEILKNIQCRTGLLSIIAARIKAIETKHAQDEESKKPANEQPNK